MKKYLAVNRMNDRQRITVVKEIFATATAKYDFLNRFLSLRRDVSWRRFTVKKMHFFQTNRLLDVAAGTADLAIDAVTGHPQIQVSGVDFVREMLVHGQEKIITRRLDAKVDLVQGDALNLPCRDNNFDVAGMAFGIRNIPNRLRALQEMQRVIVPGGQVMILEMTFTQNKLIKKMFYFYLNKILPALARPFSANPKAYFYLADSIMNFPTPAQFSKLMEEAGLERIETYALTLGITNLHIGYKPEQVSE